MGTQGCQGGAGPGAGSVGSQTGAASRTGADCAGSRNGAASGAECVGSRNGADSVGLRGGGCSGADCVGSRNGAGPGADSVGSRNGAGSGTDSMGSRNGAGSGADSVGSRGGAGSGTDSVGSRGGAGSVGSRNGAGSGADSVGSRNRVGSGADSVGGAGSGVVSVTATMASRTTGLEFTGDMPAARTDLIGGSSSLHTSLRIPGCTAASTTATRGTAAPSAATEGAVASSPTTWAGERAKDSTNCPKFRWSSPLILHQLRGSSRALLKRSLRAASLYPNPSAAPLNSTANLLTSLPCWRQELRASNWRMHWYRGLEIVAGGGRSKPLLCWVLILADPFCHERWGRGLKCRELFLLIIK